MKRQNTSAIKSMIKVVSMQHLIQNKQKNDAGSGDLLTSKSNQARLPY
jgi:hypothetical protein